MQIKQFPGSFVGRTQWILKIIKAARAAKHPLHVTHDIPRYNAVQYSYFHYATYITLYWKADEVHILFSAARTNITCHS